MEKPVLITLGSLNYPLGSAPTNRIHLYSKALDRAGGRSLVISLDAPFSTKQKFNYVGRYEGIPFCYSRKTYIRKLEFFKRNIERLKGIINAFYIIKKKRRENRSIVVLFFSCLPFEEFLFSILLKLLDIKIIKECSEAPWFIILEKKFINAHTFFHKYLKLKRYDAIIVISSYLREYYSKLYPADRTFQIPILVDLDRFKWNQANISGSRIVITYVGFMGGNKDGLIDLIDSFNIAVKNGANICLNLVGGGFNDELERIAMKINELKLSDSIFLLGNRDNDEIPVILVNSDFLILARPDNNQARAGFPTKLGEYLASKKPVIITRTGEIPNYLEDNKSAYLANPGDINDIAQRILYAINDCNARKIGLEGFKVAERYFDYKKYSEKFFGILTTLCAKTLSSGDS